VQDARIISGPWRIRELWRRIRSRGAEGYKPEGGMLYGVNRKDKLTALRGLARSQNPFFDPAGGNLPVFAEEWFERYERSDDVTHWYGSQCLAAEHSR
jgi:hypothetical protein